MGGYGEKWAWGSNFNEYMNVAHLWHAYTYLRKLKVILIVIDWAWSNMGKFSNTKHLLNVFLRSFTISQMICVK